MQQPSYDDRFVPAPAWEPAVVRMAQGPPAPSLTRHPGHPIPRPPPITSSLNQPQPHDQAHPFAIQSESAIEYRASEPNTISQASSRINHPVADRVSTEGTRASSAPNRPINPPLLDASFHHVSSSDSQPSSSRQSIATGISSSPTLTSPPRSSGRSSRPQKALIAALQLAQEAVQLDSSGDYPISAVKAYARSVALLNDVMEKAINGEHSQSSGGRPSRSLASREEEVRKLRSIVS